MMIKFSWKKINNKLDWNIAQVVEYFYEIRMGCERFPIPKGPCFILNIKDFFDSRDYVIQSDVYIYLELASKRNIFDYKMRGVRYLPAVFAEEYQLKIVENSKLFNVENNNIHFKYEQEKQYVD